MPGRLRIVSQTDTETLRAYDHAAAEFAEDWRTQPTPSDMYALVREYLTPGPTADIECGSGRDTSWLTENGFFFDQPERSI